MSESVTEGLVEPFGEARGFLETVTFANPAAGASFVYTVEGKWRTLPLFAACTLVSDGNAANREVVLQYLDGNANAYAHNGAGLVITATTTQLFTWQQRRGEAEWAANTRVYAPLSPDFLEPGYQIKILVSNVQVGDQLSGIVFRFERLPTGPRGEQVGRIDQPASFVRRMASVLG